MNQAGISTEFFLLCFVQIFTIVFSLITFIRGLDRYRRTDPSEIMLRKSVKYFAFTFVTITCIGVFSMVTNFFFLITQDGFVAGYLYGSITTGVLVNVYCAWQFLTYLIHPERRNTKYIIGIFCLIGIILVWFFPPTITSVFFSPNIELQNLFLYIYTWSIFAFVYGIYAFDFLKKSYNSSEKEEKYRFLFMGTGALFSLFMFPVGFFGIIYSWIVVLNAIILLYLGYNFPKFFQRALRV